jgi:hypothetical protein
MTISSQDRLTWLNTRIEHQERQIASAVADHAHSQARLTERLEDLQARFELERDRLTKRAARLAADHEQHLANIQFRLKVWSDERAQLTRRVDSWTPPPSMQDRGVNM